MDTLPIDGAGVGRTRTSHGAGLWLAVVLQLLMVCCSASAWAQDDAAITEATLREPWALQLGTLQGVSADLTARTAAERARLDPVLEGLAAALGRYETQVDRVIDRIVGDPQFAYAAAEVSRALSLTVTDIHAGFAGLYAGLGMEERPDVRAAQEALVRLRTTLGAEAPFERDVIRALGSGSRELIVGLATRWWTGEEQAIAVRKAVTDLRRP